MLRDRYLEAQGRSISGLFLIMRGSRIREMTIRKDSSQEFRHPSVRQYEMGDLSLRDFDISHVARRAH